MLASGARTELEERITLPVMVMELPPNSLWQAVLTCACKTLPGLCALPDGPGRQLASGGTGWEPIEQGSGDRMQGLSGGRRSRPSAGNRVLRHYLTGQQDGATMALLRVPVNSSAFGSQPQ